MTRRLLPAAAAVLLAAASRPAAAYEVLKTDPKGDFDELRMDVGGFIQPRFISQPEDEDANSPGEVGFAVRRARFELKGDLDQFGENRKDKKFGIASKIGVETIPEARLVDAYVNVRLMPEVQLRAGQFKAPTGRSWMVSDRRTLFPERGEITELYPGRQMGAMVHGRTKKNYVEYGLGAFNGEGTNRLANVNRKFLYAGRVVVAPLGSPGTVKGELLDPEEELTFSVGYSGFLNVIGPEEQEEATIGHNAEAFFHWRWVSIQGEYLWRFTDWQDPAIADFNSGGYYAQIGSFVPAVPWAEEHVALLYKFQELDELDATEDPVSPTGPDDPAIARRTHTIGAGIYAGSPFFPSIHTMRLQVEYTIKQELEAADGTRFDGAPADSPFAFDNNTLVVAGHLTF